MNEPSRARRAPAPAPVARASDGPKDSSWLERAAYGPSRSPLGRSAARLVLSAIEHQVTRAASAMAFDFFLGIVPLLAAMGYVLGAIGSERWLKRLATPLFEGAPGPAAAVASEQFFRFSKHGAMAPLGLVGFVWLASGGAHTAIVALRVIAGAPPRPWWRSRAAALAFVFVAICLAAITATTIVFLARWSSIGVLRPNHALVTGAVTAIAALAGLAAATAALYRLTHGEHDAPVWPGTLAAVAGFVVVTWGFGIYVDTLGRFSAYYGGLAAVAMLLGWIWLSSVCLLVGAEVNALIADARSR